MDKIEDVLPKILKKLRDKKKISGYELANKSGLTRSAISRFESGTRKPTVETIFMLSKGLGIKPHKIILAIEKALKL